MKDSDVPRTDVELREAKKRRRELILVVLLGLVFLVLTWVGYFMTSVSQKLPFIHSIFFFGLVNLNIALLLFLLFLIFRNVVKIFVERQSKLIGSSLKAKLVAAFVAFSFVPTLLMFLISVFYINSNFDKWFSAKVAGVLKDSLEVTNAYYTTAKKKNYHFAHQIARILKDSKARHVQQTLTQLLERYRIDAVEYYPGVFGQRSVVVSKEESVPDIPRVSMEFLQKGVSQKVEASMIHHFGEGNLVRVIVPLEWGKDQTGAVVVSSFVPMSLISKMDDIAAAYDDFRDINPLEYPIKSIYLIILVLMTLVILLAATWFGFHLAKTLSTPLELLGIATRRVSEGNYQPVGISSGSQEITQLIESFNQMTSNLDQTEKQVNKANHDLKETLNRLDEHSRYIEVVLTNITTGVVSANPKGLVTTINSHAEHLLGVSQSEFIGQPFQKILKTEQASIIDEMIAQLKNRRSQSQTKEVQLKVGQSVLLTQFTVSLLKDEKGEELGIVFVFDDLTVMVNAQRAAAWREVARRIAHEIKNPLTPIRLSAQRLEKKFGSTIQDPAFSSCTETIIKQVDELKNLVNEFSNFARLPQAKPIFGSLNGVISEALVLFQTGHKDIQFQFQADETLPDFAFDPEQIKRVLNNLLDNSVAALELVPNGTIELSTQYDKVLKIAKIEVVDNGPGILETNRNRIFEPYFSTKKQGTGLGLAIVKRIVEDHNGFIRMHAHAPSGTKMTIELPVVKTIGLRANKNFSDAEGAES
jgi:two-component system nitrogen regulation sensor histidine kinase NtrY